MTESSELIAHAGEPASNEARAIAGRCEPRALRTYTPTQAVLAKSAGIFLWTPEGRRLYDFTSGVLVTNLGHNPAGWLRRFVRYLGWPESFADGSDKNGFTPALPLNAYNALTQTDTEASRRLVELLQSCRGGRRLEQVLWAASGSEAIQKALWAALHRDPARDGIIATRHGFHGKKGLAGAVSGCESDPERDPRVHFVAFPMSECADISLRDRSFDVTPYVAALEALRRQLGRRLSVLITEPYLGSAGSYHPPPDFLHALQRFCRENDIVFVLDEVQSNFGRTRELFALEAYGLEPDIVVLGKSLGNGVPVAAAVGRKELLGSLEYGEGSDTYSANPLACAGVLATLDEFAAGEVLQRSRPASAVIEAGLVRLKELPFVAHVRGERGGMVWGVEMRDHAGRSAAEWANAAVLACYRGADGDGIHLLGPLSQKILRIAPPLVISEEQAVEALALMFRALASLLKDPKPLHDSKP